MTESKKRTTSIENNDDEAVVSYSHVQLYVDRVEDLATYKALEEQLNAFSAAAAAGTASQQTKELSLVLSLEEKRQLWRSLLVSTAETTTTDAKVDTTPQLSPDTIIFCPQNRDVVKQLLAGFGFRVTGARYNNNGSTTRSVLVTSRDPAGVQILVTAAATAATADDDDDGEEAVANKEDAMGMFGASEYMIRVHAST